MRKMLLGLLLILLVAGPFSPFWNFTTAEPARAESLPQPVKEPSPQDQAVLEAFAQAKQAARAEVGALALVLYDPQVDSIHYSADGSAALLWLYLTDPETGEVIASEPGLSVAALNQPDSPTLAAAWSITLPSDSDFTAVLADLPADLFTEELRQRYLPAEEDIKLNAAQVFTGYKLPWAAGLKKRVTNSIGHVYSVAGGFASCPGTCRYAYDFADGTMFPLLASKGGTVKAYHTSCANGDPNCTNYLVLEDRSTTPTTYQLYYHMAYESIPARLRTIGTPVLQGEYIGNVDDTGVSTGHHLHFHVYTSATGANWSWGPSVDFRYDDVTDNGGYPRTCAEAAAYPQLGAQCQPSNLYLSGNLPAHPPSVSLTAPRSRQELTDGMLTLSGQASDDLGITRALALVNYNGTWKELGDLTLGSDGRFNTQIDLCAAGVPDGPFSLAVRVYDVEGGQAQNQPALELSLAAACAAAPPPPPACAPGANQVALYSEVDFRGQCQRFDVRSTAYSGSALGILGDNQVSSVQVGSNVRAALFDRAADATSTNPQGRVESLEWDEAALADNRIGDNHVSALLVQPRSAPPAKPVFNTPPGLRRTAGSNPTSLDSLALAWEGGAGATAFDYQLNGPGGVVTQGTTRQTSVSVGSLPAGSYTLTVTAKNSAGSAAASQTFTVTNASFPAAATQTLPYSANFEDGKQGWTASGLWQHMSVKAGYRAASNAWISGDGASYASSTWKAGDLTSPPVTLPSGSEAWLRFYYYAEVEDDGLHWDQRRVQISANGGPFVDLAQLSTDKRYDQTWFWSQPVSLAAYAGQTVRIRFHFDALDEDYNTSRGWAVDDVSITLTSPVTGCADSDGGLPTGALRITLGDTVSGAAICPEGDMDWYVFQGRAGQTVRLDIDARTLPTASRLDSQLALLASDGASVIAENDDEEFAKKVDSFLEYTFNHDGDYYLRISAWNHPGVGSPEHTYHLLTTARMAGAPPASVAITSPTGSVPVKPFNLTVKAVDADGGEVARVDFYWHSGDWAASSWKRLGADTNPADGWSLALNPADLGNTAYGAFYVLATGKAGGTRGAAVWDLAPNWANRLYLPLTVK